MYVDEDGMHRHIVKNVVHYGHNVCLHHAGCCVDLRGMCIGEGAIVNVGLFGW